MRLGVLADIPFDVDAVVRDLRARLQPNAEFLDGS